MDIEFPVDGRGGYLYNVNITFPVYPNGSYNTTYAQLDALFAYQTGCVATYSICFGVCIMAALQIIALTPSVKRGLPLYGANLACLTCLIVRLMNEILACTTTATSSTYYLVTEDWANTNPTRGTLANSVLNDIMAPLAFLFIQICLFIQAKAVLANFKNSYNWLYRILLSYLISLGFIALLFRTWYSAETIKALLRYSTDTPPYLLSLVLALYAASIASWSLVFTSQLAWSLYKRKMLISPNTRSNAAMNILVMTGVESMILPLLFCILELGVVNISWFPEAEVVLLPSVAVLLPFGSLWASAVGTAANNSLLHSQTDSQTIGNSGNTGSDKVAGNTTESGTHRNNSALSGNTYPADTKVMKPPVIDFTDRQLDLLDAMTEADGESTGNGSGTFKMRTNYTVKSGVKGLQSTKTQVPDCTV